MHVGTGGAGTGRSKSTRAAQDKDLPELNSNGTRNWAESGNLLAIRQEPVLPEEPANVHEQFATSDREFIESPRS